MTYRPCQCVKNGGRENVAHLAVVVESVWWKQLQERRRRREEVVEG